MKLIQKRFPKGRREFEIIDNTVYVRIKGLLKEEKLSIDLSKLNPAPEVNGSELEFHSRTTHGYTLSLLLDNPNADEFNAFVDELKQRISSVDYSFADSGSTSHDTSSTEALGWNVYEEPPEFDETDDVQDIVQLPPIKVERVEGDITMLKTYLDEADIKPLIDSLESLKADPGNEVAFRKMVDAFEDSGINQGAILTYAPYLKVLLSQTIS